MLRHKTGFKQPSEDDQVAGQEGGQYLRLGLCESWGEGRLVLRRLGAGGGVGTGGGGVCGGLSSRVAVGVGAVPGLGTALEGGVPPVLDGVVCAAGEQLGDVGPPVAILGMCLDNPGVLLAGEGLLLEAGGQLVEEPAQCGWLSTSNLRIYIWQHAVWRQPKRQEWSSLALATEENEPDSEGASPQAAAFAGPTDETFGDGRPGLEAVLLDELSEHLILLQAHKRDLSPSGWGPNFKNGSGGHDTVDTTGWWP